MLDEVSTEPIKPAYYLIAHKEFAFVNMLNEIDIRTLRTIDEIATRENIQIVIAGIKLGLDIIGLTNKESQLDGLSYTQISSC